MTNPVQPDEHPPGLVEPEGTNSEAEPPDSAPAESAGFSDPDQSVEPRDDGLLGPADPAVDQPGQELGAGEG